MIGGMNQTDVEGLRYNFWHHLLSWRLFFFTYFMRYVIVVLDHHLIFTKIVVTGANIEILQKPRKKKEREKPSLETRRKNRSMYGVVADILKNMCTNARMKMFYHIFSCQRNKIMNRKVSTNCPKDKHLSSIISLEE